MEHRGEILRAVLVKNRVSQRALALELGIHHNTVANYLDRADLSDKLLLKIGKKIRVDMSEWFPSLRPAIESYVGEPAGHHLTPTFTATAPESLPACQQELMRLQAAHITLLHEHLSLVRKYQQVQAA